MTKPFVSVIVTCHNERNFIAKCIESILSNDYPKDRMEVLIMDGMSDDGTREIIRRYADGHGFLRMIDNERRITSTALNKGIQESKGEMILWMGAHNAYSPDYIRRSVEGLLTNDADNVGGVIVTIPRDDGLIGRSIALALSHPFGVGNSYFRTRPKEPMWVDTVFGGCYRRSVFDRIGLFNERLTRGQDVEFNIRLRKSGGKILLMPDIVSYYYARSQLMPFLAYSWTNGVWALVPFFYSSTTPVSWRHLTPMAFVSGLLLSALASAFLAAGRWLFLGTIASYAAANLASSLQIAARERKAAYFLTMPVVFAGLHFSYGLGSIYGWLKMLIFRGK